MNAPYWAASDGQDAIIRLLLDAGASVNAADLDGWTPLHFASENGQEETVNLLLDRGADIDADGAMSEEDSNEEMMETDGEDDAEWEIEGSDQGPG